MSVNTSQGSRLYISSAVVASTVDTIAEFEALTWIHVGEIENFGEFGDEAQEVTFTSVTDGRVRKFKGAFNAGNMTLQLGFDGADTGQAALKAAQADTSSSDYGFRVSLNDGSSGSPSQPTIFYFRGKVMSNKTVVGGVNDIAKRNVTIGINSTIYEDSAV